MPLTYSIDESAGLITLTASGQLTASDIAEYLETSRTDQAYRQTLRRLVVVDGIEGFPQLPEVQEITKRTQTATLDKPMIAAVADTPLGRGMIAMFFGHWGLSDHYRLFDDVPTALAWLGSGEQPA